MSDSPGDDWRWRWSPAANVSLVNNAWSLMNRACLSDLLKVIPLLLLRPLISLLSRSSPHLCWNVSTAQPIRGFLWWLSYCRVNKWWPSWQDCKFVFLRDVSAVRWGTSVHVRRGTIALAVQPPPPTPKSPLNHLKSRFSKWNNIKLD